MTFGLIKEYCGGGESPLFFMDQEQVEMYLKTSDFYLKESEKALEKSSKAKTREEKIQALRELIDLKSRITREVSQISKICSENEEDDGGY